MSDKVRNSIPMNISEIMTSLTRLYEMRISQVKTQSRRLMTQCEEDIRNGKPVSAIECLRKINIHIASLNSQWINVEVHDDLEEKLKETLLPSDMLDMDSHRLKH